MAGRGIQAMQQAVKNINTPKGGGGGRRFNYFGLEDGESIIVRFVTDEDAILTCDFYEFVEAVIDGKATKQSFIVAPDYYADDPSWQGEDWVLKYGGVTEDYNTKEKVPPKPKERTVAIAVEREAIPIENTGGRPKFRYQDKLVEVTTKVRDADGKETGEEKTLLGRNFILIRKDAKTFWGNVVGYYGEFGTLVDRDYKLTRSGKQLATNYSCIPVGPEEEWTDVNELRQSIYTRYGYGTGKDVDGNDLAKDSEDRLLYCPMTLDEWAEDQASEDRAKALLTANPKAAAQARHNGSSGLGEFHKDTTHNPASDADEAQAAPPPASGDVSALRARLEAHK